jgi:hypothetical protein
MQWTPQPVLLEPEFTAVYHIGPRLERLAMKKRALAYLKFCKTVDLIKVACVVKMVNNIFNKKWS